MASAAVTAAVSVPSSKSSSLALSSRTAISSTDRITFNKTNLYPRNVSKSVSIRAQVTTEAPAKVEKVSKKNEEGVVTNKYKPKSPYIGRCLLNTMITGDDAPGETWHMVFSTEGEIPYREGQSIGVIPDGIDKNGKPHKLRLYSIASSALGDFGDSKTVSLCVKRLVYTNDQGEIVKGVCSNFLCDLKPGAEMKITGPVGKEMLMPKDPNATIIMLGTGTGIAPFRSFLWKMFFEKHDDYKYNGLAWLFLGVPTSSSLLYKEEFEKMKERNPDNLRVDFAVSREQTNEKGEKMYIQTRMAQYAEELWELLKKDNTYVYMCGLKGMEKGIDDIMVSLAAKDGIDWSTYKKELKKADEYYLWRMAFMDEELDEIEVYVYNEDIKHFQSFMHEGEIYKLSNVMVCDNESDNRLVRNEFKIILNAHSKVEMCTSDISRTPLYKYNFVYLNTVNSFLDQKKYLFDVIVMVIYVGPICEKKIISNRDVLKRDLIVLDQCLNPITITLWGKLSEIEGDWLQQNIASNPILLASGVKATSYKGLAISTFEHSTLKINPSIVEAAKLFVWMKTNMQAQRVIQRVTTCEDKADILFNATKINCAELHTLLHNQPKKITYYRMMATICEINKERSLWYTACTGCNKQVRWIEENPYCEHCCIDNPKTFSRYILRVKVKDFSGETRFTIFDKNVEFLLGVAANKLQLIKMQDGGDKILNDIIDSILWKSYTILISSKFKRSMCGDEDGYVIFSIHDVDYTEESYAMLREIEKTDNDQIRKRKTPS